MTLMRELRNSVESGAVDWGGIADKIRGNAADPINITGATFYALFNEARTFVVRDFKETKDIACRALNNPQAAIDLFRLPYPVTALEMSDDGLGVCFIITRTGGLSGDQGGDIYSALRFQKVDGRLQGPGIFSFQPNTLFKRDKALMIGGAPIYNCETPPGGLASAIIVIMGIVSVINSPAVADTHTEDYSRLNASRAKKGLSPIEEFHTISIKKHIRAALKQAQEGDSADGATHAPHWRRGHFKARRSGIYWWNPHVVGVGEVDAPPVRDYRV